MNRRHPDRIDRREAVKRIGASTALPLVDGLKLGHPRVPSRGQEPWRPVALDSHQARLVTALAELIIPETDTPGAATALVHEYIDFQVSQAAEADRRAFLDGLAWVDSTSRERYGVGFLDCSVDQRTDLLSSVADAADGVEGRGQRFFRDLKRRTVEGYYTSRVGMQVELGYRGNAFLLRFEGCTHPEHLEWEPREPGPR